MFHIADLYAVPRVSLGDDRGEVVRLVNKASGTENLDLHLNRLAPGAARGRLHKHSSSDNVYIIKSGTVELCVEGEVHQLREDHIVHIPAGVEHSLSNISDQICELFEIYAPAGAAFDVISCD